MLFAIYFILFLCLGFNSSSLARFIDYITYKNNKILYGYLFVIYIFILIKIVSPKKGTNETLLGKLSYSSEIISLELIYFMVQMFILAILLKKRLIKPAIIFWGISTIGLLALEIMIFGLRLA